MPSKSDKKSVTRRPRGEDIKVRDCLVWQNPPHKGAKSRSPIQSEFQPPVEGRTVYLPRKGEVGRAMTRGYDMPDDNGPNYNATCVNDEGTVIEALRGWPGDRRRVDSAPYESDAIFADDCETRGAKDESNDPYIGDLISHRYLSDAAKKRIEEKQKEEAKAERSAKKLNNAKCSTDIKANRTAQLRSIANAERVETSPHDLWKMSKFTKSAKPHITTFRKGKRADQEKGKNGVERSGNDVEQICTCSDDIVERSGGEVRKSSPSDEKNLYNQLIGPDHNDDDDGDFVRC